MALTEGEAAILAAIGGLRADLQAVLEAQVERRGRAGGIARAAGGRRVAGRFAGPANASDAGDAGGPSPPASTSEHQQTTSKTPADSDTRSVVVKPLSLGLCLRTSQPSVKSSFDAFWAEYPRKVGKHAAWLAYRKAEGAAEAVLEAMRRDKRDEWRDRDVRMIPHASTWLNQRRWEDDRGSPTANPKGDSPEETARLEKAAQERREGLPAPPEIALDPEVLARFSERLDRLVAAQNRQPQPRRGQAEPGAERAPPRRGQ